MTRANGNNKAEDFGELLAVAGTAHLHYVDGSYVTVVAGKAISTEASKLGRYPRPPEGGRWHWLVGQHQFPNKRVVQAEFKDGKVISLTPKKTAPATA